MLFFYLMIRLPPRSTLFPTRRSSDLVGADLRRDDRNLERDAELGHGRVDEIAVGVGQDRQLPATAARLDRKSTRLNSSHRCNSYAVFCLKKENLTVSRASPSLWGFSP